MPNKNTLVKLKNRDELMVVVESGPVYCWVAYVTGPYTLRYKPIKFCKKDLIPLEKKNDQDGRA